MTKKNTRLGKNYVLLEKKRELDSEIRHLRSILKNKLTLKNKILRIYNNSCSYCKKSEGTIGVSFKNIYANDVFNIKNLVLRCRACTKK